MKTLLATLLLTAAIGLPTVAQAQSDNVRLDFGPTSKIWVTGTSSVHDWHCAVTESTGFLKASLNTGISAISAAEVHLPVSAIDCDSKKMDGKVRDALNDDDKTPHIAFVLDSATIATLSDSVTVTVTGDLTIAASTQSVTFDVTGKASEGNTMTFTGSVPVLMSDHGVDPPTAMFGALKTGDEVVVHFEVVTTLPDAQ